MKKILLIEDDKDIVEVVDIVLTTHGYNVYTISRVQEIFPKIKEVNPDLILLDIYFHGINRINLCKEIKVDNNEKKLPIILFSASPGLQKMCEECGAAAFIEKPFDISHLPGLVKNHISQ